MYRLGDSLTGRIASRPIGWAKEATFEGNVLDTYPDGFDSTAGAGAGDLTIRTSGAMSGLKDFECPIPDNSARFGVLSPPAAIKTAEFEFLFDPNTLTMATSDMFWLSTFQGGGSSGVALYIYFAKFTAYNLRIDLRTDAGALATGSYFEISDAPMLVTIRWAASSADGADDGFGQIFVNGVLKNSVTGVDNDGHDITSFRLGAISGVDAGTGGVGEKIFFDNIRYRVF